MDLFAGDAKKRASSQGNALVKLHLPLAAALLAATAGIALAQKAGAAPAPRVVTPAEAEDARLTAFLDAAFDEQNSTNPQTLTQLGSRQLYDRLNDYTEP